MLHTLLQWSAQLVLCTLVCSQLSASSVSLLDLGNPAYDSSKWNGQEITVRGFLYRSKEGQWVLASQPNLKSCCVGNSAHVTSQVAVEGDGLVASSDSAVTLKGQFRVQPTYGREQTLIGLFYLSNAAVVAEEPVEISPWLWAIGLIAIGTVAAGALRHRRHG